jgi:hypothetical protein
VQKAIEIEDSLNQLSPEKQINTARKDTKNAGYKGLIDIMS